MLDMCSSDFYRHFRCLLSSDFEKLFINCVEFNTRLAERNKLFRLYGIVHPQNRTLDFGFKISAPFVEVDYPYPYIYFFNDAKEDYQANKENISSEKIKKLFIERFGNVKFEEVKFPIETIIHYELSDDEYRGREYVRHLKKMILSD